MNAHGRITDWTGTEMFTRRLGRSGIQVSAMGLGCWAIGGPWWDKACHSPAGWGQVDDRESIRAIQWAVDAGITLFDTSDNYGCGHSERVLGRALARHRHDVVIATKFGYVSDEASRQVIGTNARPGYIRRACEASLRRLRTDYIDLYQFHIYDYPVECAIEVRDTLEELVGEGKIRWYGWSTNNLTRARVRLFVLHPYQRILPSPTSSSNVSRTSIARSTG